MNGIKLKLLFVLLMLIPIPFSCKDKNECLDLYVEPYFSMQELAFNYVDLYSYNVKTNKIMWHEVGQDYDNIVYPCDSMALYIKAPDDALLYHSQNNLKHGFTFTQEAFACNSKRSGWAGTRELVDKIYISSNYAFDETHAKDYDLSDIVEIFAYTTNGKDSWMPLNEYNKNSPYEAPKRFYLLIKRKPTLSNIQQFVIKYYMKAEPGEVSKSFVITTPVFQVR